MSRTDITARFDAAFERAQWRFPESPPKWLYLDEADWAAYDRAVRKKWPSSVRCFSYRDVQIRSGKRSILVTKCAAVVVIPKRLSALVRAAPATRRST